MNEHDVDLIAAGIAPTLKALRLKLEALERENAQLRARVAVIETFLPVIAKKLHFNAGTTRSARRRATAS
jgi:hypothetical protein